MKLLRDECAVRKGGNACGSWSGLANAYAAEGARVQFQTIHRVPSMVENALHGSGVQGSETSAHCPARTSQQAAPLPKPLVAPVIKAVLPFRLISFKKILRLGVKVGRGADPGASILLCKAAMKASHFA